MFYFVVDPSDVPNELFTYKTSDDIGGYPYWGIFSTYGGGGYVTELGTTMTDASSTVDTIMNNNWVDNNTRAIFIEVNLYNPNNNLFGICLYVLEFLQTGGTVKPLLKGHLWDKGKVAL
jgi:hypothetical protein